MKNTVQVGKSPCRDKRDELADKLAKEASGKTDLPISHNRVLKSVIKRDLENTSVETWQREWDTTTKGRTTKDYFPNVAERLHTKIHLTQKFTMVTGHGNIESYLHRLKSSTHQTAHAETTIKQNTYYWNAQKYMKTENA